MEKTTLFGRRPSRRRQFLMAGLQQLPEHVIPTWASAYKILQLAEEMLTHDDARFAVFLPNYSSNVEMPPAELMRKAHLAIAFAIGYALACEKQYRRNYLKNLKRKRKKKSNRRTN